MAQWGCRTQTPHHGNTNVHTHTHACTADATQVASGVNPVVPGAGTRFGRCGNQVRRRADTRFSDEDISGRVGRTRCVPRAPSITLLGALVSDAPTLCHGRCASLTVSEILTSRGIADVDVEEAPFQPCFRRFCVILTCRRQSEKHETPMHKSLCPCLILVKKNHLPEKVGHNQARV